ncbi:MAG: c-type cytochrome [Zoogloeaceae bacterium]|jgi:cytochrome c553|nr:c-type cytochrome [Zoogloeaceae bacterium]
MMRTMALALVAAGFGLTAAAQESAPPPPPPQAASNEAPSLVTGVCVQCHGATGASADPALYPHLSGQVSDYIVKQLRDFKAGVRNDPVMTSMAYTVATDEDARAVANWYAGQTVTPSAATQPDLIERGKKLWRAGDAAKGIPACSGCHGASGQGLPAQYPRLSGQLPSYLAQQLQRFRNGERANDPEGMMRAIAERLTDNDVKSVSEYASGLR